MLTWTAGLGCPAEQPRNLVAESLLRAHNSGRQEELMTKRVVLAAVLGSIAIFAWTSVAHMVLHIGESGVQEIPNNEQAVLTAMQAQIGNSSGFYIYPGMGLGPNPTHEQQRAAMAQYDTKLASNPTGILIYHPPGTKFVMSSHL